MPYEVSPGQCVLFSGTRYPEGALVPSLPNHDELVRLGIVRAVERKSTKRPEPTVATPSAAPHAGFDSSDPASVKGVSLRHLSACLAAVDSVPDLQAMHDAETRKGGLDKIEERIGELTL